MKKSFKVLTIGWTLILSSHVYAADCSIATSSINTIIKNATTALNANNLDNVSAISKKLRENAKSLMTATDNCACDDAYYSAEVVLENAKNAYLSSDLEEAMTYLSALKDEAASVRKFVKRCGATKA